MKIIYSLLLITLTVTACQQGKKEKTAETESITDTLVAEQDPHDPAAVTPVTESLAKMAPHSREEMLLLLPPTLRGVEKKNSEANDVMGVLTAVAEYAVNDSTTLELIIIDCAGPAGVGIYNVQYAGMLGFSEEDEKEYTRTIDFAGGKAFEHCKKTERDCSLTWFVGRYLVSLSGPMDAAQLKEWASGVPF